MVGLGTGAPIVQVYHEKSIILPDVSRVLACLYEKDIKFETHTASYKSLLRLQASSHAPVPFYDGPTFLEESREICHYIAEKYEHHGYPFLLGKDALERASVEQWLHNEEHAFNPPSRALFCHLAFPLDEEDDGDDIDMHVRKLEEVLEVYEQRLSDSKFLAGNEFTLADLVHLPNSHYINASNKFLYLYDSRKNVRRLWDAISNRNSWKKVLRDMKSVEEQEELKKQQEQQKEHPRISGHPIRIDPQKKTSTEPRTILIPPADTVLSSPRFPQTEEPLPFDTFPNEALVSSSQSTPIADKTSAVFTTPQEIPPTSVRSTPVTSKKYPIPVQSTKGITSPTTAKKPPITDAAKSITKDASTLEPTETDLPTRHVPTSSEDVSNNLDVFDHYPSHTDEETPYIEPTPRKTSETLDTFAGSKIATGHTKTSSISAKEEPDQPSASDFYKSDSRVPGVDSQYKESVPYSGRTPPKLEPTDTSASKLHTTDVHCRLQAEQWHTATTGLNDLKQDADHLMSTQQGKPRKDVKQYPSQDSEQATSHPVPEEPMSMEFVQRRENTTQRPCTDQRSRGIVEDKASSDQRSALPPPSTQEHGATPSRQEAAKDARGRIPSQAGYPGGQDTNKQPRDPASVPRQRTAQDARGTFGESKVADSTVSSESFSDASGSSLPRQDLDGARHTTVPFQKRDPGTEDTSKQAKDKISTPWQMTDQDAEDTTEETKISDSSSPQMQPSYFQRADAPSRKQETTEDRHSATSAIHEKHANVEDTAGISRDVAFKPKQMIGQDDQDTLKETKSGGPSLLRDQQSDTWQAASTLPEQEVNQDGRSVAPPSQKRYPSSTPPSKTRYQISKDASKQPRGAAPTPKNKTAQDENETSEESKTADEVASTKQPLNAWRAPISPRRQEVDSSWTNTSFQKRYPDDEEDMQVADTASASRQIAPDGGKDIFVETKLADSTTTRAKPLHTQPAALPIPRQGEVEDADKGRQSRVTIPEPQKMVARDTQDIHGESKTATPGEKSSDRVQAIPQSRLAAAKDVHSATGETIQFPEILDITKKPRGTFEETKDPDSTLPRAQSLGARDAQRTNGESRTPTADQRKDVSRQLQPDAQDPFQQSKLPTLTPSRQTQVEEARDKSMPSRETIPEQQKMVERKAGISGEPSSDRQKAIRPSRQAAAAEDAPTGDTKQSPHIPDSSKKSRGTFEEAIGPGSTLPKAQALYAQDSQLTKGESTMPTADQRKDWKDAKDDETIMTEEKSFSTEQVREMFQESESTTPKTQPADSQGYSMVGKTSPVYQEGPLAAQPGGKVDSSTPEHQESSGAPYTYAEKLSASAPAREDIRDDHSAEKPYKKYTADGQKVSPSLSSKEPASQVQPLSEPLQRAVPDGDSPSKTFTIHQWQRVSAPLHGVGTDSGDAEVAISSNNDQKSRPASQEATLSSPVPIRAETSDFGRTAPSLPEAARADDATIDDKFAKQSNIDERVGAPKKMQEPIAAAHPALATTPDDHEAGDLKLVKTPEGPRLEAAKATQDPATIQEDVHDASLSTHDAAIDEKITTYHAIGDDLITGYVHDRQARPPASTQAQPTVETPDDSDSSQYVHTGDSGKAELAKPIVTDQEATAPIAGPTSMDSQRAGTVPAEVVHSEQKSALSDKGSARAAQPLSPVEPVKADSNVSPADYTNAPQMIFWQQARPSAPSTIGISASDTQGVIGQIQEVTPDDHRTDDSGKPFVPSQGQVSHASQAIPGQEEMTSPPGASLSPTSDTQLASAEVQQLNPDDQQAVESITPLSSSGKQGSHVESAFGSGAVGPAEKKFAPSDQELPHAAEQAIHSKPRKEQTVVPTAEQIKEQPTIIGQQDTADTREALTSEDALDTTPTHGDVHPTGSIGPDRRPLSVQGEEPTSATQAPPPHVAKDSLDTEDISTDASVQSLKPSTTPGARGATPGSSPGELVVAEQKSSPSGQDSADPAEPAFSLGPRNEEIRDSTPSELLISSTDPSKGDAIVAVPDQAKDSQTTPSRQDILSAQRPSGNVQKNIPGDDSGKDKPFRPSSAVREGKPSKAVHASAPGIQLGSVPNEVALDEQKFAPSGDEVLSSQDSAYPAQPPSSAEPRSKEIGDLAPSTQLNSTTEPRNGDAIVAGPDQAKDSQTTPGQQGKLSAPSSYTQHPSGTFQEDEPAENSGEAKSSKPPLVSAPDTQHGAAPDQVSVDEEKFAPSGQGSVRTTFPTPAPGTQYGTELHKADVDGQKFSPSVQDSVHSVQPSFSTEPTKEDTVVAATDQTSTLEKIIDQNDTTPAPDKAKTPFSGTPDASRETQKSTDNDHIDEKLPGQGRASPSRHVSESPEGPTLEAHSDVDKETTLGSNQGESSNTGPDSTPIGSDARLSRGNVPAASSLRETEDLQGSAYAQNVPVDSLGKIESPGHLPTDQAMEPRMSPTVPSVTSLGTVSGTNSVQPPRQASMASTVDLESVPYTQHGTPQGEATPAEQKFAISDQEPAHTSESPSSAEPRKEEANAAAGDQPNVPQGPETTVRHQVKAPSPDVREDLRKDQQPSRYGDHISNSANPLVSEEKASHAGCGSEEPSSEVSSAVVDKKMTLPSSQAQTSSTGPESTPISGDTRLSSADVPATSSLQYEAVHTPAATQVPTPQAPLDSASTQNVSAGSLGEISSEALSDVPQDQVSAHASEPPFSAEPSNEASHAGRASESHEGTTPEVHSAVVDAKTTLPSRQVQTANTGPDSTPISGDLPDRSSLQNQEAQPSAATQAPTVQAQGSASTKNEPADSLGDIKSRRQLPTDEVVAPITSFAAPSDSSQGTEPGTNSVQPSEVASFDFSSDENPNTAQGHQAKTLRNGDLPTSQVVGQSESADFKGMDSQKNLKGASTDENPKTQQQIEQFDTQSFKDNNKKGDPTVRPNISTTFEDLQKQPSVPKGSMELSDEQENQQQTDQAIVQSVEGNENQSEQTKARDTVTGEPEDMEASENTNQKNNRISQVETSGHSGKEASGVQRLRENTKDAPSSTEDAPGDVQAISKSKESSRSSEESKVQLQSEDKTGETEAPNSETGQPRGGDLPANRYQNNSSQSQTEAADKSVEQSYPGIQDMDSGTLDDSTDSTKPGDMEDKSR